MKFIVALEWAVLMISMSANNAQDIYILVKDFPSTSGSKIFWIPEMNATSYQKQDIELSNRLSGFVYNSVTYQVLLPEYQKIWSLAINTNTTTLFADVSPVSVQGLALDASNGDVYFVGSFAVAGTEKSIIGVVDATNGDVTNITEVIDDIYKDITLDYENRLLFWSLASSPSSYILRSNTDGSNKTTILTESTAIYGLTIDIQYGRLYWSDFAADIFSCNLNGNDKTLFYYSGEQIIDLKVFGDYVYFVDRADIHVTRINKNNSDDVFVLGPITDVEAPYHLDVYISEGLCPRNISNGMLTSDCGLNAGDSCNEFTCFSGFIKTENVESFNCTSAGNWSIDVSSLCIEMTCRGNISNGALPAGCESKAGESCDDFTCKNGFERNGNVSHLTCTSSGTWSSNLSSLCIDAKCPTVIAHGRLSDNCSTDIGAACDAIICDQGHTKNNHVISLVCSATGSWKYNISFQCDSMENAISCLVTPPSRTLLEYWIEELGNTCDYQICNTAYKQQAINDSVVCMSNDNWSHYNTTLCSASECNCGQRRGHADSTAVWTLIGLGVIIII